MIFGHFSDFLDLHDFRQNIPAQSEKPSNDIKNQASRGFRTWKALLIHMNKLLV